MNSVVDFLNSAVQQHQAGNLDEAERLYQQILRVDPQHVDGLHLLGVLLHQQGKNDLASDYIGRALKVKPDLAEALSNLGPVLQQQGKLDEAVATLQQALRLKPNQAAARTNLGNVLKQLGRLDEAVACYREALQLQPGNHLAHNNLGNTLAEQGQLPEAVACFRQALRLNPAFAEALTNLGATLRDVGELHEALASCQDAVRLAPHEAVAQNNLGTVLQDLGEMEMAADAYRQAALLDPNYAEAHNNLGMLCLLQGDFQQGWPEYEWRQKCNGYALAPLPQPLWDGSRLDGKTILLRAEQGLGDTLQFVRYAPLVRERGGRVLLACPPALTRLLASCNGIDELILLGSAAPQFDVCAPLLSLPHLLGTDSLQRIPAQVPYLEPAPDLVRFWRQRLQAHAKPQAGFRVGIVWQGNPNHKNDRKRSAPLTQFAPLADLPGVSLVSLQKGPGREQLERTPGLAVDLGPELADLADTAAAMRCLDLVISVDTAVAHLAGALAVPVWMALPHAPDWRWLLQREDSPWYPTMRLFRQPEPGDWKTVFARIADSLKRTTQRIRGTAEMSIPESIQRAMQLHQAGNLREAEVIYRQVLDADPHNVDGWHLLGVLLHQQGKNDLASDYIGRALKLKPDLADALSNLGAVLLEQGKLAECLNALHEAIRLKPDHADAHNNLGNAFKEMGKLDEALASYRQALRCNPDHVLGHINLGNVLQLQGKLDETLASYREALRLKPDFAVLHSNLIFNLYYDPASDAAAIYQECRRWNQIQAEPLRQCIQPHANQPDPQRKLRIGYVSPDFREHPLAFFIVPLLANHDRGKFEIFCYANVPHPDAFTQRMRGHADVWRSITGLPDQDVAEMVRADRIDILVELTMHSANNRLLVFARKPAPVQVAWLGINGTTGLSTIDYRLTDAYLDPPGQSDAFYSEESIRLPDTFWCYDPLSEEPLQALPALANGYVTFGSTNNFYKINDGVLQLWAAVLQAVPRSRLLLLAPRGQPRDRVRDRLQQLGVAADRVEFADRQDRLGYLRLYHRIDLALDTYPYNGHTTSLDAFWMGVPTITLVGKTVVGREGYAQLCNLGLKELAAATVAEYVAIAVGLAGDPARLSELRAGLRRRMLGSPLMDAGRFARNIEDAYRHMWRRWCQENFTPRGEVLRTPRVLPAGFGVPHPAAWGERFAQALRHQRAGDLKQAEELYRQILQDDPRYAEVHNNLGVILRDQGKLDEAVACFEQSVRLKPDYLEARNNQANVLQEQRKLAEAVTCYQQALLVTPGSAETHNNLALALVKQGKLDEAIAEHRQAVRFKPDFAEAHNHLAIALQEAGSLDEALACCRQAVFLKPDFADAHANLGNVLRDLGKPADALACYREVLRLRPDDCEARNHLAVVLKDQGKLDEAEAVLRQALALKPDGAKTHNNLGNVLLGQGNIETATACYRQALLLKPNFAEAHTNLGMMCLLQGDLERGWPEYAWRWKLDKSPRVPFPQPLWDGSPLDGKTILLMAEQGLGDSLQFIRYAALVRQRGGRVLVACPTVLERLLASCDGVDGIFPAEPPTPDFDVYALLLNLPRLLGTTSLERIPAHVPYLEPDPGLVRRWRERLGTHAKPQAASGFRVGIAWQGSPGHANDRQRSVPLAQFAPLAELPGVTLFSLQKGPGREQLEQWPGLAIDLGPELTDLADTAAVMRCLDLVISVDTAVAHLAGALAVPVWLALPAVPDWRWLLEREDSPWYPAMRLFRQTKPGNWNDVFERMTDAMQDACHSAPGPQAAPQVKGQETAMISPSESFQQAWQHYQAGNLQQAEEYCRQVLQAEPAHPETLHMLGLIAHRTGRIDEAVIHLGEALRHKPNYAEAHNDLGIFLRRQDRLDESVASFRRALLLKPDYAEAYSNLGNVLKDQGKLDEAAASYREALRLKPDYTEAHKNLGMNLLLMGDFEGGWPEYEWRWKPEATAPGSFTQPAWDGSPLDGKTILLHAEQGLGDTLQFIRYAPLVQERGGRVLVACPTGLMPLLARAPGVDKVFPSEQAPPASDVYALLLSLPRLLGTNSLQQIPAQVPYLEPDPDLVACWRQRLEADAKPQAGFRVGIVWQGSTTHQGDRWRSVPLAQFAPLADIPGVTLISLQKGPGHDQLQQMPGLAIDMGTDLANTAALMRCLDLVVSVDTALAHLAGALAVPLWVALSMAPDWRWLLHREDSPWYPTMRLFRQTEWGDWKGVFERMAEALHGCDARARKTVASTVSQSFNLALQHHQAGNLTQAAELYRQVLHADPGLVHAHNNLGIIFRNQGKLDEAAASFRQALRHKPDFSEARGNLGNVLQEQGKLDEAAACYQQALWLNPDHAEAHNNLALTLVKQGKPEAAAFSFQQAVRLKPSYAEAHNQLGNVLRDLGRLDEAVASHREALRLKPDFAEAFNDLGNALKDQEKADEALASYRQAIRLKPGYAAAHKNLGVAFREMGKWDEAVASYREAVRLQPDYAEAHRDLGMLCLLQGDFGQGWPEYEWRWRCKDASPHPFPQRLWDGSPLDGKTILLLAEQGLGDTLQFVRYAPLVRDLGGKVLLACPAELVRLLASCSGVDQVLASEQAPPNFDVCASLLSLPRLLGTSSFERIPARVPYLEPDAELVRHWRERLADAKPQAATALRVGIAWQGSPSHKNDRWRSVALAQFAPLAELSGVTLVSLQKGPGREQLKTVDLGPELADLADTAAAMRNLDLVIGVDTAVVHLAGALAVPIWVALPAAPDWRWLLQREDSPWYPTMRLFRQTELGNWSDVFEQITSRLRSLIGERS